MRVVHLSSSFPRGPGDPNAPYLGALVRAQRDAGLEPMVVVPHDAGLSTRDELDGVPVRRFRYAPGPAEVLAYRGGLLSTARRPAGAAALGPFLASLSLAATSAARAWGADVVHAHWWMPAGLAGVRAAGRTGAGLVITCHGSDVGLARRAGFSRLARRVLARADVVGAVSEALAAEVRAVVPGTDPVVLRMPFRGWDGPTAPLPDHPPLRLLAVGRLMPEKGFDLLVSAVAALKAGGAAVTLGIVGDGPLRDSLAAQVRGEALDGVVSFEGSVTREQLGRAIDASHAVVVPSRREGLGLVAVDAMDRRRPVVAAAVGGLPETLLGGAGDLPPDVGPDGFATPRGILVRPGDVAALARALRRLPLPLPPPGPVPFHQLHDPARVAAEHLQAYERAAASRLSQ